MFGGEFEEFVQTGKFSRANSANQLDGKILYPSFRPRIVLLQFFFEARKDKDGRNGQMSLHERRELQ